MKIITVSWANTMLDTAKCFKKIMVLCLLVD